MFKIQFCVTLVLFLFLCQQSTSSVTSRSSNDQATNINSISDVLQDRIIQIVDDFDKNHKKYPLIENYMTLIRTQDAKHEEEEKLTTPRSEDALMRRISKFIHTHRISIKVPESGIAIARNFIEERSSKFKRFIIPFVILMILKKSIEVPITLAVLSILAFKGLGAGLISLMLSGATAFKSLLEHHHPSSKVSYEVVPQFNHWNRNGNAMDSIDYPNFVNNYHTITS